jgi:DNA-binding MarR family transcriptional regulator
MVMTRTEATGAIDDLLREILTNYLRPPTPRAQHRNVTMGQMECLHTISRLGNPTMSEVAKAMRVHPSTVTALVDGLVAHGLVARRPDPEDRRVIRVAETAQGRKDRARHMAQMRTRVTRLLSELSDEDIERVYDSLRTLRDAARSRAEANGER